MFGDNLLQGPARPAGASAPVVRSRGLMPLAARRSGQDEGAAEQDIHTFLGKP